MTFPITEMQADFSECQCPSCRFLLRSQQLYNASFLLGFVFPPAWLVVVAVYSVNVTQKKAFGRTHKERQEYALDILVYTVCFAIAYSVLAGCIVVWLQNGGHGPESLAGIPAGMRK